MDIGYTCGERMKEGHAATPTTAIMRQIIPTTLRASYHNKYISGFILIFFQIWSWLKPETEIL